MEKIVFLDRSTADRNGPGTRDVDFSALEGLGQVISHDITNPEDTATRIADAKSFSPIKSLSVPMKWMRPKTSN